MIIKPNVRMNVAFNAHPKGLEQYVLEQVQYLDEQPTFSGAKKALILGGSTGYGLASKLALGVSANTDIISVSYEAAPDDKRTGSAGFWNNVYAAKVLQERGVTVKDFLGDAFSDEMRARVATYIRNEFGGKIDLLVYSLASGRRTVPATGVTYNSTLKVIGEPLTGLTLDLASNQLIERTIDPATETDIANTVKVMGGEDWALWIDFLQSEGLLADNFKTVTYSYIGPEATKRIYRSGTIGAAKEHMEQTALLLNQKLQQTCNGEALTAVCKAAVTRASSVIPIFPLYGSALIKVMEDKGIEELPHEHIYRLFNDMIYGTKREVDEAGRVRPDNWEMRTDVQTEVDALLEQITADNFSSLLNVNGFSKLFYNQNGFGYEQVNYDEDIDLFALAADSAAETL